MSLKRWKFICRMRSHLQQTSLLILLQHALSHLSTLDHVGDLWRQHKRTAIVPLIKVRDDLRRLGGLVFVHEMAGLGEDGELVFPCCNPKLVHSALWLQIAGGR
jgi:hypothetical protein